MAFEFATAGGIVFGEGAARAIPQEAAGFGNRVLLLTGRDKTRAQGLLDKLLEQGFDVESAVVDNEPSVALVNEITAQARAFRAELVIALGGGSVIDTGKAVAAMLANPGEVEDYLEVVGRGQPLSKRPAPCIAVPTTAGTGAEVTRNAVLAVPEKQVKVSMRSPLMIPDLAVVDPELTYSMPSELTASTGLDALTQLLEAFVTPKANPLTDGICREGLARAFRALPAVYKDGNDKKSRSEMALASTFGGLALANARLGAVHGFAGPLGGMIAAPHGAICARLLPLVTEINVAALEARAPESAALQRYREAARMATGDPAAEAPKLAGWLSALCAELNVRGLAHWGLEPGMISEAVTKARRASSMQGNPVELSEAELTAILERAL